MQMTLEGVAAALVEGAAEVALLPARGTGHVPSAAITALPPSERCRSSACNAYLTSCAWPHLPIEFSFNCIQTLALRIAAVWRQLQECNA